MRMSRVLLVFGVAALFTLATAPPAQAGGWAVTYLDPLPERFEVGRGYTLGFWVLQHGSHAYEGDLGKVGITLVDMQGKATPFTGVPLPERAHYAAAISVAHPGSYQVIAVQGVFREYQIGTLTAPGRLTVASPPTPMAFNDGHEHEWGIIRPPVTQGGERDPSAQAAPSVPAAAVAPIDDRPVTQIGTIAGVAGAAVVAIIVLIGRRTAAEIRRRRATSFVLDEEEHPIPAGASLP